MDGYKISMSREMKDTVTRWLQRVLAEKKWDAAELARRSGVSASTLSRALNPDDKIVLNTLSMLKIARITGINPPGMPAMPRAGSLRSSVGGFAEAEAEPFEGTPAMPDEADNVDHWTLRSRAIDALGYIPGDIVAVDRRAAPRAGDIVQAQLYGSGGADAETVFRAYDPPYLVTRALDPMAHRKPVAVDGERALIVGVVVALWRRRPSDGV